jgi:four helix bundle protein
MLKNYKDLKAWQKAYGFCLEICKTMKKFPGIEQYGLASQITRSAVSIPCNIAEGYGRKTTPEYLHFLYRAYGTTFELETRMLLAGDLGYLDNEVLEVLGDNIKEVERMLKSLIQSLEKKQMTTRILESLSADRQA